MSVRLTLSAAQEALTKLLVGGRLSSIRVTMTSFSLTIEVPSPTPGWFTDVRVSGSDDSRIVLSGWEVDEPGDEVDSERLRVFGPSYRCLGSDITSLTLNESGELILQFSSGRYPMISISEICPAQLDLPIWSVEVTESTKQSSPIDLCAVHFVREGSEVCFYQSTDLE